MKKKNNQKIQRLVKYIGAFITVVVIIAGVILILNNQETTYNDAIPQSSLGGNVATKGATTKDGKLVVFATNNNNVPVDLDIEVKFYDASGAVIDTDSDSLRAVGANAEVALQMYETPNEWKSYKIFAKAEETLEKSYYDMVAVDHSDNGDNINVQVTNNSSDTIEYISVAVVYYQNGEVVGYDFGIEPDTEAKSVAKFNIYYPDDGNNGNVEFNSYQVLINEAFTYNYDNAN